MDKLELRIMEVKPEYVTVEWDRAASTEGKVRYRVFWSGRYTPNMEYKCVAETAQTEYVLYKSTHIPHYLSVSAEENGVELARSEVVRTPVGRFLSGVAYLDGEHPSLIVCRGYYTRTTIVAYDFSEGRHRVKFDIDSGHVSLGNPFSSTTNHKDGSDPVYGALTGQGDHSLAVADVDGDGCQEIIYGEAVIDHDGSLLYSSKGYLPDGRLVKLGHGDSMHVAVIDPEPGISDF